VAISHFPLFEWSWGVDKYVGLIILPFSERKVNIKILRDTPAQDSQRSFSTSLVNFS